MFPLPLPTSFLLLPPFPREKSRTQSTPLKDGLPPRKIPLSLPRVVPTLPLTRPPVEVCRVTRTRVTTQSPTKTYHTEPQCTPSCTCTIRVRLSDTHDPRDEKYTHTVRHTHDLGSPTPPSLLVSHDVSGRRKLSIHTKQNLRPSTIRTRTHLPVSRILCLGRGETGRTYKYPSCTPPH